MKSTSLGNRFDYLNQLSGKPLNSFELTTTTEIIMIAKLTSSALNDLNPLPPNFWKTIKFTKLGPDNNRNCGGLKIRHLIFLYVFIGSSYMEVLVINLF